MMRFSLVFHPLVANDYDEAYAWYEEQEEGLGERFISAVRQKLESVVAKPEHFSEGDRNGYREAVVELFPFVIVYRIYKQKKEVFVNSIHHTRKHPAKKFRKK